jgi:hypothetical protein
VGDWRIDQLKILYAFCREMRVLPSQVYDEDPVMMNDLLVAFGHEMDEKMKELEKMKVHRGR